MRRVAVLPVGLALLMAFLMAPYQHVHLAPNHREDTDHDDAAAVVHIHFYAVSVPVNRNGKTNLDDSDGDHGSKSLDTFTPMPPAGLLAFALPESRFLLFRPADLAVVVVEITEPCSHDPPFLDFPIPRGPPA